MAKFVVLSFVIAFVLFKEGHSHGRFIKPPGRSSIWRDPNFAAQNPPVNQQDANLNCANGGTPVRQADNPGSNCGVCGDALSDPAPRANEIGGTYDRGIIVAQYQQGQTIDVAAEVTIDHQGFIEWRLCANPTTETQQCFNSHLLQRADGQGSRVLVNSGPGVYTTQLKLPQDVTCNRCIIQFNYRGGDETGQCEDGSTALGCGPQKTYRGCSDVKINARREFRIFNY